MIGCCETKGVRNNTNNNTLTPYEIWQPVGNISQTFEACTFQIKPEGERLKEKRRQEGKRESLWCIKMIQEQYPFILMRWQNCACFLYQPPPTTVIFFLFFPFRYPPLKAELVCEKWSIGNGKQKKHNGDWFVTEAGSISTNRESLRLFYIRDGNCLSFKPHRQNVNWVIL